MERERLRRLFERATRKVHERVSGMILRGLVRLVNDTPGVQRVQFGLLAGETTAPIEHVQPYGFTSVPLEGAEPAVVLFPQGDRSHGLAVVVPDRRHRPTGNDPGDVTLHDNRGNQVQLRNGVLKVFTAGDLEIESTVEANITIHGVCTVTIENVIPAQPAQGDVVLTGTDGAIVPAGSQLSAGGENYTTDFGVVISGGTAVVAVTASTPGASGNQSMGATLTFAAPPMGVNATATVDSGGLTGGSDPGQGKATLNVTGDLEANVSGAATISAAEVNLGGPGGQQVARVGDMVAVGAGSSAGNWPIVSGSSKVKAT